MEHHPSIQSMLTWLQDEKQLEGSLQLNAWMRICDLKKYIEINLQRLLSNDTDNPEYKSSARRLWVVYNLLKDDDNAIEKIEQHNLEISKFLRPGVFNNHISVRS